MQLPETILVELLWGNYRKNRSSEICDYRKKCLTNKFGNLLGGGVLHMRFLPPILVSKGRAKKVQFRWTVPWTTPSLWDTVSPHSWGHWQTIVPGGHPETRTPKCKHCFFPAPCAQGRLILRPKALCVQLHGLRSPSPRTEPRYPATPEVREVSRTNVCRMKNTMKSGFCSCKTSREKWREISRENFWALSSFVS